MSFDKVTDYPKDFFERAARMYCEKRQLNPDAKVDGSTRWKAVALEMKRFMFMFEALQQTEQIMEDEAEGITPEMRTQLDDLLEDPPKAKEPPKSEADQLRDRLSVLLGQVQRIGFSTIDSAIDSLHQFRKLVGNAREGTGEIVTVFQDDATMDYHVRIGGPHGKVYTVQPVEGCTEDDWGHAPRECAT